MELLLRDLRYAVRTLAGAPAFAIVAVVTLALGIGANAAIFSIVSALLLRPVAFDEVHRLAWVWERAPRLGIERGPAAPANFLDWRRENRVFDDLAAFSGWDANLTGGTQPERVQGFFVSPEFFQLLRVRPELGRTFTADEREPGNDQVVVLSHGLWQRSFGGDATLVGTTITVDRRPMTVVGVMPREFDFPLTADLWAPLALTAEQQSLRGDHTLQVFGRLAPGVSLDQARAEMEGLGARLQQLYPETNAGRTVRVVALTEGILDEVSPRFLLLTMAAVGFVLLIVCANVGSLLLARAAGRSREIAIRLALGAGRWRIVRQLLTESVLLALIGSTLGLFVAHWSITLMMGSVPPAVTRFIPGWHAIRLDTPVLGFTLIVAIAAGLIFGVVPAVQASTVNLDATLKAGGRGSMDRPGARHARRLLVVGEIGLALVLLTGAALIVSAFSRLAGPGHGFEPHGVQTLRVTLPEASYESAQQVERFFSRALERLQRLPGVVDAAVVNDLPWHLGAMKDEVTVEGHAAPAAGERYPADYRVASPGYFAVLGIRLVKGRSFTPQDTADAPPVVVVSETMARRFWPDEDPLGKRLKLGALTSDAPWLYVIGVAADVKRFWWNREPTATAYASYRQAQEHTMSFVVRTSLDPASVLPSVEREVRALDPELPIYHVETLEESMAESFMGVRLASGVMTAFAALAFLLSAIGIYGLIAYSVERQTREIGVRVALGASARDVLRLVMGEGVRLTAIAIAIGFAGSFALSRVMANLLFGVVVENLWLLLALPVPLVAAALVATYLPARKAAGIDPLDALRHE